MSKKFIVIYFGDWWDNRWRRRQQLAWRLAERQDVEKVYYIEFPVSIPELIKSIGGISYLGARDRWGHIFKHGFRSSLKKLEIITPVSLLPYFGPRFDFDKAFVRFFTSRLLRDVVKKESLAHRTVLWISHPFAINYIGKFNEELVCYDCTERFADFKEWGDNLRKKIAKDDIYITSKARLVFTQTTPVLLEKKKLNPNTHLVPNAVDYENFIRSGDKKIDLSDINAIKKPILGFIGIYNNKIDEELLIKAAEAYPNCSIVILGIYLRDTNFDRLARYDNVHYLGLKDFSEIPSYLEFFDVCLLPYKIDCDNRGGSPLKLFDYLASGKPIVSIKVSGTEDFGDVAILAENHEKFIEGINSALNDHELLTQLKRRMKAKENSWKIRADQVWGLIQSALGEVAK